jgi:hypothetical protein
MNKKVVRLTESDLENIVRRVLQENDMTEKSSCYETMEGTCNTMYESALNEGKNCMEAYKSMCGEMNTLMEEYKTKCQEVALSEGYINEEDINEQEEDGGDEIEITLDQIAMLLKDGECSCGGETLVLDLEGGHDDDEEDEDED